jgi:glycine/D-amino acid oxidase-like deaminating enzyme
MIMEETEVLVVGQGLAGTWLSWWLEQEGISYRVIDNADPSGASRHAAGLINPVTGRRLVTTWMIDELMPFSWKAYQSMGSFLQSELITETSVIDFFPTVQMLQAFQKRYAEDSPYLHSGNDTAGYDHWFRYDLGWGAISPCYLVQTEKLLTLWRNHIRVKGYLKEESFDTGGLVQHKADLEYHDIHARYIVFSDGKASAANTFFARLPFALNKGEGLLVEIKDIPPGNVFKKGMSLVPWKENIFWVGSSYQWEFSNDQVSETFRLFTENWLKSFLRVPYRITDHFAAVRPATLERRPFVGFHPKFPRVGILNGMGAKGCSLAPYFARELTQKIIGSGTIDPLADINRFERILMKKD